MAANILGMTVVSLAERGWIWVNPRGGAALLRNGSLLAAGILLIVLFAAGTSLYETGLWGMTAFLAVLFAWVALIFSTDRPQHTTL